MASCRQLQLQHLHNEEEVAVACAADIVVGDIWVAAAAAVVVAHMVVPVVHRHHRPNWVAGASCIHPFVEQQYVDVVAAAAVAVVVAAADDVVAGYYAGVGYRAIYYSSHRRSF